MRRTLSAGVLGSLVGVVASGCGSSAGLQSRMQKIQIEPNSYIVQVGDTIESIAYRYRASSDQLAALNPNMQSQVFPGQRVLVRSGRRDLATTYAGAKKTRREVPASYKPNLQNQENYSAQNEVIVTAVPTPANPLRTEEVIEESISTAQILEPPNLGAAVAGAGKGWQWPSEGEVVREYSPNEVNGQGIDIAGVPGQEIRATADGTVIYAGRDLSNSGNLVIIRHTDDVLSTYSHAKDLYVAEDDVVRGGDPIASLGWNSDRESVLHFGFRNNGKPVDPLGYLPNR